jgi:hypothetical protein
MCFLCVVKQKLVFYAFPQCRHFVRPKVKVFVLYRAPESFNKNIIYPTDFTIHTDLGAFLIQYHSDALAWMLASLISIINFWIAIPTKSHLKRFDTKIYCQNIGYTLSQDLAARLVHDGN